jgi:hypothetical protein
MTVAEMLDRMGSDEMTSWAAIFAIEDEENEKAMDGKGNNRDNEDITDDVIAMIDRDKAEG